MAEQTPFIRHELVTSDQEVSGAFFSERFGWSRTEVDAGSFGTYTRFQKDGLDVVGIVNPTPETAGSRSYWHAIIAVVSVDGCAERVPRARRKRRRRPARPSGCRAGVRRADATGAIAHRTQPV